MINHVTVDCTCQGKVCTQCPEKGLQCLGAFSKNAYGKYGRESKCKACRLMLTAESRKAYREAHRSEQHDHHRAYWKANRSKLIQVNKQYYQTHRAELQDRQRQYYQKDLEKSRTVAQVRNARRNARRYNNEGSFSIEEWLALKAQYNHTCLRCGKQEPEIKLTIDHIIPLSKGGSNDNSNIQPLCKSCNSYKWDQSTDYRIQYAPLQGDQK